MRAESLPQTYDAEGNPIAPTAPKICLKSAVDVRREMARLYRAARAGEVATGDASRLCFILTAILRALETSDLEKRLEQLERTLESRP